MDWLEEQQAERLRQKATEQARRDASARARTRLEKSPEYPGIVVEINDADREIKKSRPKEAGILGSQARLEYLLRVLDAHGKAYSRLVADLDSVKALETVMSDLAREMWYQFSGLQPEGIPPIVPSVAPQLAQIQRARIFDRAHHWIVEGYRQLAVRQGKDRPGIGNDPPDFTMMTTSERLDAAANHENISHEEQASRIGISRTAYFEVKAGRGGKKSRRKTENYLSCVFNKIDRKSGPNKD